MGRYECKSRLIGVERKRRRGAEGQDMEALYKYGEGAEGEETA